jgi:hypothetical protein
MSRIVLIVAFAFIVVGGGAVVTAAQYEDQGTPEVGTPADCGTPVDTLRVSPAASPELEEIVETATPENAGVAETIATAATTPNASPVAVDPCGGAQAPVE